VSKEACLRDQYSRRDEYRWKRNLPYVQCQRGHVEETNIDGKETYHNTYTYVKETNIVERTNIDGKETYITGMPAVCEDSFMIYRWGKKTYNADIYI
jgi:hypothetical protein